MKRKTTDNRPYFRSAAKSAAYDIILKKLRESQLKLKSNKMDIYMKAREQGQLKQDIAQLSQLLHEMTEKKVSK